MQCAQCGTELEAGARFCPSCGTAVPAGCASCGAPLAAGARFCASCGTPVEGTTQSDGGRERKVATLVFADLVGFTSLNEAHDPEIIEAIVGRAFDRLSSEVGRYEGLVEKFAGDAMLAVFGVPTVHEDDAERAVRAAFEMQQAMHELGAELAAEGRPALSLRIGIETGEVLAHPQRATTERDRIVTGDAVNTAARLEQAASPGQIVVGPGTYAATRETVEYDELEPVRLKGKALPVPNWRAVRIKAARGGRRAVLGLEAPLIGRDEEMTLLKETVRRTVAEGKPHLVTVVGSAGVGKSRLTWELEKYLDGLPDVYHWRKGRCLAYAQMSYSALADSIAADASVLDDDSSESVAAKVSARLADLSGGEAREAVESAARILLGLTTDGGMAKPELFEAWREYLELIARRAPLIVVFEDIHWADEGLLDFIEFLARWAEAPIMILCLARHELLERRPTWAGGLPNASSIVLEPLSAEESGRLLGGLLGSSLPSALEQRVIDVSEGNPLFAEELVRLFVDRGVVRHTESGWEQALPIEEIEIPQSIQALLAARLDSLPPEEKRLSQDAAVVGRIFWDRLLAHLAGQSPGATITLLRSLRVKELVVPREPSTLTDAQEYAFRHALIRDVAYDSLPKLERARKHREVARWAEERLGERAEEVVELLAAHYWSALRYEEEFATDDAALEDLRRRTVENARAAGKRAFDVSQFASAVEWMRIAIEQGRKLDLSPLEFAELTGEYLFLTELYETYEARLVVTKDAIARLMAKDHLSEEERKLAARLHQWSGYLLHSSTSTPVDEIKKTIRKGLELLDGLGPTVERAGVLHRLGWLSWRAGPISEAEPLLRRAMEEAQIAGDDRLKAWAMHDLGITLTRFDLNPEGLRLLRESMELAREANDVLLLTRCYINLPGALPSFGNVEEAMAMAQEGMERGRRSNDRHSVFWIGNNLAELYHERGELERALELQEEAVAAAEQIGLHRIAGLPEYATILLDLGRLQDARSIWKRANEVDADPEPQAIGIRSYLDGIFLWADDPAAGVERLRRGIADLRAAGSSEYIVRLASLLGRIALRDENVELGREAADVVREMAGTSDHPAAAPTIAWFDALVDEDREAGARAAAEAASQLEARNFALVAAGAYADAAILAERAGLPEAAEWSAKSRAIYERCSAVPVLEALRGAIR